MIKLQLLLSVIPLFSLFMPFYSSPTDSEVNASLQNTLNQLESLATNLPDQIDATRLQELNAVAQWIVDQPADRVYLTFICTHNSRRSHMGQVWAQAAAWHFDLTQVHTYSGGTEATAFNPRAIQALRKLGVGITESAAGQNPTYAVELQPEQSEFNAFSKKYSHSTNPQKGFAAVMTCSHADEFCPLVFGADARFSLPYVDPKVSDGTPLESETYKDRALQIGSEMFYIMAHARKLMDRE